MSGEFLGKFENSVNKQRITIPAGFKKKFSPSAKQSVVLTLGPNRTIAIYPLDNWQVTKQKLENGDERQRKLLLMLRQFASIEQTLEGPGRIRIPEDLLSIAGINDKDKVILKGDGNYISIWNKDVFQKKAEELLKQHLEQFESLDYQI